MKKNKQYFCPRDKTPLVMGRYNGMDIVKCPSCHGFYIKQKKVNNLLEAMTGELQNRIQLDSHIDKIPDKSDVISCPGCEDDMEHYGYMGDNHVMLDSCHECKLLWVDTLELGAMCMQYARSKRRSEVMYVQEERAILEGARSLESINVSNAVGRAMLLGFVVGKSL